MLQTVVFHIRILRVSFGLCLAPRIFFHGTAVIRLQRGFFIGTHIEMLTCVAGNLFCKFNACLDVFVVLKRHSFARQFRTLLNSILGEKIAITSAKPQTTRNAIRGIYTRMEEDQPVCQLVFIDTPGIHKPKNILKKPTLAIRMSAGICEWCGKHTTELEVHQVRSLKELDDKEAWAIHMKRINRKTLVVCKDCHNLMHSSNG